jgi:hypothetical protein
VAFRHGSKAALTLATKDLSAFCTDIGFSIDVDAADTTTLGATWKTAIAGLPGGKVDIKGDYDPTATTGPGAVIWSCIAGGVPVTAIYYPGGNTSGQISWTFTSGLLITGYSESSPVGGVVTFSASAQVVALPVRAVI